MSYLVLHIIAVLTGAVCRASKRSLIVWCALSGQVPCSGARRRDKVLDEVSTAILGDAVAENLRLIGARPFRLPHEAVGYIFILHYFYLDYQTIPT